MEEHTLHAPQLGESVKFLRVLEFLKKPGDSIMIDEPIIVVETDKASMEIESPVSGIVHDFKVALHDEVPIGNELVVIKVTPKPALKSAIVRDYDKKIDHALSNANIKSAFLADYSDIQLSGQQLMLINRMQGSDGQIISACLHAVCESEPVYKIRKYYRKVLSDGATVPSSTEIFIWCTLKAMRHHAKFRSMLLNDGKTLRQFEHSVIGVAVGLYDDELAMLNISDRECDSLLALSKSYKRKLAETRVGNNHSGLHSLSISDLSSFDIQSAVPVIVSPAIATLCIGRVYGKSMEDRAYNLSLCFDHRIINGVGAASFLKTIKKELYALNARLDATNPVDRHTELPLILQHSQ